MYSMYNGTFPALLNLLWIGDGGFISIIEGYFTSAMVNVGLPERQWSNPEEDGSINHMHPRQTAYLNTKKQRKAKAFACFVGYVIANVRFINVYGAFRSYAW